MTSRTSARTSRSSSKGRSGQNTAREPRRTASTVPAARVENGAVVRSEAKGGKKAKKAKAEAKKKRVFTAKNSDPLELYQLSVQSPVEDVRFLTRVYRRERGKNPLHFREDFCGTAYLAAHWIKRGPEYTAEGFDIDADTIGWGIDHNFAELGEDAERCTLHVKDVREPSARRPDVRCAQNFSYFVFKTRPELMEYLRAAYRDLARDGVFVMDIYGGPESMEEMTEVRKIDEGFTYVWDQDEYWPATGEYTCYIHFRFKDGSEIKRAFRYDWRLWTLMEVKEALEEVGFQRVDTYWEGTDEDGESGNGIYRRSRRGENCMSWVTYLIAYK